MKLVTQNAIGIINKLIVTAKYNRNTSNVGTDRYNYYEGRLSALCDVRQWINNKQKGKSNETTD